MGCVLTLCPALAIMKEQMEDILGTINDAIAKTPS